MSDYEEHSYDSEDEAAYAFEKPAWARGSHKLKSTGKADAMKTEGNLAAAITFTPFKSDDHTNYVASPTRLKPTSHGEKMKTQGNLANPITHIRDVKVRKGKR